MSIYWSGLKESRSLQEPTKNQNASYVYVSLLFFVLFIYDIFCNQYLYEINYLFKDEIWDFIPVILYKNMINFTISHLSMAENLVLKV